MAATPFKVSVSIVNAKGLPVATLNQSASDVANAFTTNDADGLTFVDLPNDQGPLFLGDIFLSAAGVDTTQLELWVNGVASAHRFRDAALASAANVKRVPSVGFNPGRRIAFKQLA